MSLANKSFSQDQKVVGTMLSGVKNLEDRLLYAAAEGEYGVWHLVFQKGTKPQDAHIKVGEYSS